MSPLLQVGGCSSWRQGGAGPGAEWSFSAAIIEHVRDGSVVRALLLPEYYLVTVMLSGIKVSHSQGSLEEETRPPRVQPLVV